MFFRHLFYKLEQILHEVDELSEVYQPAFEDSLNNWRVPSRNWISKKFVFICS